MEKKKYIHYGHKEFSLDRFNPIVNCQYFSKPTGGLWASPVDADNGWKVWCEAENFRKCEIENSFTFTLRDDANVLYVDSKECLSDLPKQNTWHDIWCTLDFEKLMETYDAVELNLSAAPNLYFELYGWDCDSILILNPYVVEVFG